jgi:hypothetical protein
MEEHHHYRNRRENLKSQEIKYFSVLLSWFSGTPYTGTQRNRLDKMHR